MASSGGLWLARTVAIWCDSRLADQHRKLRHDVDINSPSLAPDRCKRKKI
jgi:hypothetical protein